MQTSLCSKRRTKITSRAFNTSLRAQNQAERSSINGSSNPRRAIHKVLRDNASKIDEWLTKARIGTKTEVEGYISSSGAVIIKNSDRLRKTARRIRVTIIKKEHNGMIYYVQTVKLYH
ncbi:hypothetical protein OQ496_13455 [Acetobacter suratthaniensis]|uniref:Bacterial CdiA-CT RNAse A domain-containing protein n=1 Tax=Acetobacter suratthaniensis TaxID=1502841 RepID=A0ABS3LPU8_9PROT|nr:RNase A-like domain-containing protein [Acetobacter suratthaniensis]MBO1329388.1 hypothetical protein [Acetobacter suratthaniensis]MCX2567453.1 hypothetical protein [Acetobacter suratthaniensis]